MPHPGLTIENALNLVESWIENNNYQGYEPFDGLTSYLRHLTLKSRVACQILQQGVRRFPVNLRPLLGIKPLDSTKGRGYVAWGYLKRYQHQKDETYRAKLFSCLDWLDKNKSPFYSEHSWGNHFLYASRNGYIPKYESTLVWTGLIGQVFLEAYWLFGDSRHRDIIESIANWIMDLPRENTCEGSCLSYVIYRQSSVHNANMIGAAFLAGAAIVSKNKEYERIARQAMEYSCARQRQNGSWYYGEKHMYHWIDVFHTGYNLDSLNRYATFSNGASFASHLSRGFEFFVNRFFEPSGRVKYYFDKALPIDIQCASQAIDTLLLFSSSAPECIAMAKRTACWYIRNMQDKDGHFHFRRYAFGIKNTAAMIHWGQATMYKSLANLVLNCY